MELAAAGCTSRFLAHFPIHSSVHLGISTNAEDDDGPPGARSMGPILPPSHAVTLEPSRMANDVLVYTATDIASDSVIIEAGLWPYTLENMIAPAASLTMTPTLRAPSGRPFARSWGGSVGDVAELLGHSPLTSMSIFGILCDTAATWAGVFRTFPLLERLSITGNRGPTECDPIEHVFLGLHTTSLSSFQGPTPTPQFVQT